MAQGSGHGQATALAQAPQALIASYPDFDSVLDLIKRMRDMPLLIDLYMQKRLKIDELVSKKIKLEDVNSAFEAMEKGEVARSVIVY